jgi:hypothetical protein
MSSFGAMTLAVGIATAGAIFPASAEPMMWWELGVTPLYGYADDYPQRPRTVREAYAPWGYHHAFRHAAVKARQ